MCAMIIDGGGVFHAALAVAINQNPTIDECNFDFMRYIILSQILTARMRFKDYYTSDNDFIIALDSNPSWRKLECPEYKAPRKISREASGKNWKIIFHNFNLVMDEIIEYLPYAILKVPEAECDDIIAVLAKNQPWPKKESIMFEGSEETLNLIYSNDNDFRQSHQYNFTQYFPKKKVLEREPYPEEYLLTKIIKGDVGDGIPNIRSDMDTLLDSSKRQLPVNQKYIDRCLNTNFKCLDEEEEARYKQNKRLIDFNEIPIELQMKIMDSYQERIKNKPSRSKLMFYFTKNSLNKMLAKIQNF